MEFPAGEIGGFQSRVPWPRHRFQVSSVTFSVDMRDELKDEDRGQSKVPSEHIRTVQCLTEAVGGELAILGLFAPGWPTELSPKVGKWHQFGVVPECSAQEGVSDHVGPKQHDICLVLWSLSVVDKFMLESL